MFYRDDRIINGTKYRSVGRHMTILIHGQSFAAVGGATLRGQLAVALGHAASPDICPSPRRTLVPCPKKIPTRTSIGHYYAACVNRSRRQRHICRNSPSDVQLRLSSIHYRKLTLFQFFRSRIMTFFFLGLSVHAYEVTTLWRHHHDDQV